MGTKEEKKAKEEVAITETKEDKEAKEEAAVHRKICK